MSRYLDSPHEPPFLSGEEVESITHDHTTAQFGRRFFVQKCYWTDKGWRIKVHHPRFAGSSYYARKFKLVTKEARPHMYLAVDITDNPRMESKDFNLGTFDRSRLLGVDTSMDRFKPELERFVREGKTVAIFALDTIAETATPPVRFRSMR